jgi:hypothetical protein
MTWCNAPAMRDAATCPTHTTDDWMGRLPAWRRRAIDPAAEGATLGISGKDLTGARAA